MSNGELKNPLDAIGKLLFFDYNKNMFGFISEVKCAGNVIIEKVYVSEFGLATNKQLHEGELVTFLLHKGHKGFYADNVKALSETNLKELSGLHDVIGVEELEKAINYAVRNEYHNLDSEDQKLIIKIIQKENNINSWRLLVKIFADEQIIERHISAFMDGLTDAAKIVFLREAYHTTLLKNILSYWTTQDEKLIIELIEVVTGKNFQSALVSNNFINIVIAVPNNAESALPAN